jgi:hypothetical protein
MARRATNFDRFGGNKALEELQKSLPSGITVNLLKDGTITYTARASETTIMGFVNRATIGTFGTVEAAIRASIEFRYRGFITKEFFEKIKGLENKTLQHQASESLAAINAVIAEKESRTAKQATSALTTIEQERALSVNAILNSVPPHEIPIEGDYHLNHPVTGEPIVIPASKIAAWFKLQEAGIADSTSAGNGGESFSGISQNSVEDSVEDSIEDSIEGSKEENEERLRVAAFFANTPASEEQ